MTERELDHEFFEQVRQEHEELRNWLGRVHQTLSQRSRSTQEVIGLFDGLSEHVNRHFDDEEQGGFFDQVVAEAPRFSERAEALRQDHGRLRTRIGELADAARTAEGSDSWWQQLDSAFHEFSKELMHHENQENELLQDAYDEDVGDKD